MTNIGLLEKNGGRSGFILIRSSIKSRKVMSEHHERGT